MSLFLSYQPVSLVHGSLHVEQDVYHQDPSEGDRVDVHANMKGNRRERGYSICGSVVEYIVAIDVTRVRFPADAYFFRFPAENILFFLKTSLSRTSIAQPLKFVCVSLAPPFVYEA